MILECCVDTIQSALIAEKTGANRLELCGNLVIGGTTPSQFLFSGIRERSSIPIHVMIRPRYGDFLYDDYEFGIMLKEIELFKFLGAQGVVFGVLTADGELDTPRMRRLCHSAGAMKKVLHRAFDKTVDPFKALEEAKALGITTILTSGQQPTAVEGKELLKELVSKQGEIEILVGSGVNAEAISVLKPYTGANAFHLSGRIKTDNPMRYRRDNVPMGISGGEEDRFICSGEVIRRAAETLGDLQ